MKDLFPRSGQWGQLEAIAMATVGPTFGKILVVMPSTDPNYDKIKQLVDYDRDGAVRLFTTLESAYEAATTNRNDVILLSAHSTHTVATMMTWSKNRIHVRCLDGGTGRLVQQAAKVELTGAVAVAAVMKCTGVRNSFKGIKFIQSSTDAAAINVVQFAGEGNYYEDCSFLFGVVNNLDETTAAEALMGEDAGTFVRCSFGTDVLLSSASTGRAVMRLDAISGASSADGAKSNRFVDCEFFIMSSSANAVLVKLEDTAGAKFLNHWIRPRFIAVLNTSNSAIAITNAIASATSFVEGSLVFDYPTTANCTNGCAGVTANVVVTAPAISSNAWEGGTPA